MVRIRRVAEYAGVLLLASILVGSVIGQPVIVGFVETGSMEPTLDQGDGFVAIPPQVAGPIERGDVVTYRSEKVQGGRLVTHRVTSETSRGYVTKGDANAFTDQQSGEPPVQRSQVVAVALEVNNNVLVIPELGTVVRTIRATITDIQYTISGLLGTRTLLGSEGIAYLIITLSVVWYLYDVWRERSNRQRTQDRTRSRGYSGRRLVGIFTLLIVLAATLSMVAPSGQQSITIDSVASSSEREGGIVAGESTTVDWNLTNSGYVPMAIFMESDNRGVTVQEDHEYVPQRGRATVEVTVVAPDDPGRYQRTLNFHSYLAILPSQMLEKLYAVNPWMPIIVIDALIGIPFYLFGITLIGSGRIRNRSRNRDIPPPARLRRALKKLY